MIPATLLTVFVTVGAVALAAPAQAFLAGSTFNATDGDLTVEPGETDWNGPAPNLTIDCDLASKLPNNNAGCFTAVGQPVPASDTSFGQGTKSDGANVTVVTGSIPPNKSDLSRFYTGSEFTGGNNFLYLAWERSNVLGSANMNFEINQKATPGLTSTFTGPITLNRTAGDLLVTFDFGGSGAPVLSLAKWVTSGPASQCVASNSLPCWGNQVTLTGDVAQGSVNSATVSDSVLLPSDPVSLPAGTFGEAAINLTAAGVFPAGTCEAFGSAMMSSRSSASFTAELKDFIAPVPVNISNCGEVKVIKHTDPRGLNQDFGYTSNLPTSAKCASTANPASFTLNDNGNTAGDNAANTEDCTNVLAGSYKVTEGAEPPNFTLESLSCTATGGGTGSQDAGNPFQADITVTPGSVVTCTYVNKGSAAILVTKTAKNHNLGAGQHPLAGATFTVNGVSKTTGANGQACFDGLIPGNTYAVTETSAPAGYSIDTAAQNVTASNVASCTSGTPNSVTFTDSPLTDISANATSQVPGVTNSTITCVDSTGKTVASSGASADPANASAKGLTPGTYTCTITIDP
ncbi:MAG TPA: prealbumin-like fold domain-containing protein [Streptosporangiaceae bacterium]